MKEKKRFKSNVGDMLNCFKSGDQDDLECISIELSNMQLLKILIRLPEGHVKYYNLLLVHYPMTSSLQILVQFEMICTIFMKLNMGNL